MNSRPAYTSAPRQRNTTVIADPNAGASSRWIMTIRGRQTTYTVTISLLVLAIIGGIIAITGVMQARNTEQRAATQLVSKIRVFSDRAVTASANPPVTTTEQLLYGYLQNDNPGSYGALLGRVDGQLRIHQGTRGISAYEDQELVNRIDQVASDTHAIRTTIKTSTTIYSVTIVPVQVLGSDPGQLIQVFDHRALISGTLNLLKMFFGVSLLVATIIGFITWYNSTIILKPLNQFRSMVRSIVSEDDLSKRLPESADNELHDLTVSFNNMIDRLETAFEEQRNLLNDAGHELRTPLTVVRGHMELMNIEDPAEVEHTRTLVLDELSRMQRMTEDLVTVATISRPDFLHPAMLDVADLTIDTFENARQLGDFNWQLRKVAGLEIYGDRQRLQQALLQLCQNATKFAPAGSTIDIGSAIDEQPRVLDESGKTYKVAPVSPAVHSDLHTRLNNQSPASGHWLVLWVRDRGEGIEEKDQHRIFERFARVNHAKPGSGLGLSIVDAIVQAHNGKLELRSLANIGSVFSIVLPITVSEYEGISE